jgi:hypothetical protein
MDLGGSASGLSCRCLVANTPGFHPNRPDVQFTMGQREYIFCELDFVFVTHKFSLIRQQFAFVSVSTMTCSPSVRYVFFGMIVILFKFCMYVATHRLLASSCNIDR